MRLALYFLVVGIAATAGADIVPPPRPDAPPLVTRSTTAMGTPVRISVLTTDEAAAEKAITAAFAEIARLELLMTTWREDSEVSRVNAQAGIAPVKVSPETYEVLKMSARASQLSSGAFDITFYALKGLWKFDEDLEKKIPKANDIKKKLPLINYKDVILDDAAHTAFLRRAGMRINLGGIAKGYAVDRATAILRKAGFPNALIQAGGDLMCAGTKGGKAWGTGIRDPRGERGDVFAMISLADHAFSTAGDYERFFLLDGKRYHHILDPKTGYPAARSRSVTLYAPTAFLADALDDAVFIMGWQRGFEMLEKIDDVGAVVVDENNQVHISKRIQDRVKVLKPPEAGL